MILSVCFQNIDSVARMKYERPTESHPNLKITQISTVQDSFWFFITFASKGLSVIRGQRFMVSQRCSALSCLTTVRILSLKLV